jgi:hypothetical protein
MQPDTVKVAGKLLYRFRTVVCMVIHIIRSVYRLWKSSRFQAVVRRQRCRSSPTWCSGYEEVLQLSLARGEKIRSALSGESRMGLTVLWDSMEASWKILREGDL